VARTLPAREGIMVDLRLFATLAIRITSRAPPSGVHRGVLERRLP
jgi:hypothetical protein